MSNGKIITFRMSKWEDYAILNNLLLSCFGNMQKYGALDDLENRYLLAFDGDKVVAMTGLKRKSGFNGCEIELTCVHPEYRKNGIAVRMIAEVIRDVKTDIYILCYRVSDKTDIGLKYAMNLLGFKWLTKGYKRYESICSDRCNECIYRREDCTCGEDLYVRKQTYDKFKK